MSSPASKLTKPDWKDVPIKSCELAELLPEPVTVYSAELELEVSPVRVTVKRNIVVSPEAPSGCAESFALMLRIGGRGTIEKMSKLLLSVPS